MADPIAMLQSVLDPEMPLSERAAIKAAIDEIERLRSICEEAQDFINHDKNCAYFMGRTRNCSCGFDKMWSRLDETRRG